MILGTWGHALETIGSQKPRTGKETKKFKPACSIWEAEEGGSQFKAEQ